MEIKNNIEAALGAGAALGNIRSASEGAIPFSVIPDNYGISDLEFTLPQPLRKRAEVRVTTTQSFIDYTKKHGSLDDCTIYANISATEFACSMTAIINDHGADKADAQWRDHRCLFAPALSVEWQRWTDKNASKMSQGDFATWLEDNLGDIAIVAGMPNGAQMLAMALQFEATAEKRLASRINLQSGGMRFEYVEDEDKNTRTSMEVFSRFTIGVPVFEGSSDAYPVEARLKYRDNQGKLAFWFELIRPDRAFKTAVIASLDKIKADTGFQIIHGAP